VAEKRKEGGETRWAKNAPSLCHTKRAELWATPFAYGWWRASTRRLVCFSRFVWGKKKVHSPPPPPHSTPYQLSKSEIFTFSNLVPHLSAYLPRVLARGTKRIGHKDRALSGPTACKNPGSQVQKRTFSTWYSRLVPHGSTDQAINGLIYADRTGCGSSHCVWPKIFCSSYRGA
jgi:hypothetical protein